MKPLTLGTLAVVSLAFAADAELRDQLFRVEDFAALAPEIEILSERTEGNVIVSELTFQGAPFNGSPTRIYAHYARPVDGTDLPGVVQIHGAGLGRLKDEMALEYAKNGFACLSIDWAGPAAEREKPRTPPTSEFVSPGAMAAKVESGKFRIHGVEKDTITNGVRFVLRGLEFLRSREEVDATRLFLSGTSAGAHLTLLAVGVDDGIFGASVKYGAGYIRDLSGYFGGYFGPLSLSPKVEQDAWLEVLDPKVGFANVRANVLMFSGTDDIFFWMPVVLETYRRLPAPKHLIMMPNDNHRQVSTEKVPMRYFESLLGRVPAFPSIEIPTAKIEGDAMVLETKVLSGEVTKVDFVVKRMPLAEFRYKEGPPWELIPAAQDGSTWTATILPPADGEQIVAYANGEDGNGGIGSSDTVEVPEYPKWRGQ